MRCIGTLITYNKQKNIGIIRVNKNSEGYNIYGEKDIEFKYVSPLTCHKNTDFIQSINEVYEGMQISFQIWTYQINKTFYIAVNCRHVISQKNKSEE
jgi:hypothetical protein